MTALGSIVSRLFIKLRVLIVAASIAGAVWAAVALPSISVAGAGALGGLVPNSAPALTAERISAERFGFPLLSQTLVVVRNPRGLRVTQQVRLLSLAHRLSTGQVRGFLQIAGALPLINSLGAPPFSREHSTTALLYLYFRPRVDTYQRTQIARRLVRQEIDRSPGEFVGVTGEAPGRVTRTALINSRLKWVELATILLVALAIAVHFRAPGAAALTVSAVAIAYVLADRAVAQFGKVGGVQVPAEVQPVLVVLVFGVVTDYSVFFLSRFRALLAAGREPRDAGVQVTREIAPIVFVAGITVAAGTAALLVAKLEFLRAFGPGLAIAVLIAMIVAVVFVPTALTLGGRRVFWPSRMIASGVADAEARRPHIRRLRSVRFAVRHPVIAAALALAIIFGAASGLLRIALGNELVLGLPPGTQVHRTYKQATTGFTAGVLAPAVVVITGPQVGEHPAALDRLQTLLATQPGVTQVVGPAQERGALPPGTTISRDGGAARYALFLSSDPLGARAISEVRRLQNQMAGLLDDVGLPQARGRIAGDTALSGDTVNYTLRDLARVTPTVLAAIFVVIALFLRALVAPAYLVLTSALAALASLGLTVYVMQVWLGYGQITYYVIFIVSVLLVSLGSDYNVFLVGRIWQEVRRRPVREAVEVAGSRAARPIATAGFVLALSFALLALVPIRSFREIALAMACGLLIDAFVVRTILVPALLALFGRRSGWPGRTIKDAA